MGEEPHPLDPRQEPPQGRGPVSAAGVIVERLDDQPHPLGLAQYQPFIGLEHAICVRGLSELLAIIGKRRNLDAWPAGVFSGSCVYGGGTHRTG